MDSSAVIQLIILILLVAASAFFSSAETALTTVSSVRIRALCDAGDKRGFTLLRILDKRQKMLSAILVGNNLVNIGASALATSFTIRYFGSAAVGITTGLVTFVVLVFGEITPKTVAMQHAESMALAYSGIIFLLMQTLTPVIFIVNMFARLFMYICGINPGEGIAGVTEQDLRIIVDAGHKDGAIESEERTMINNVFDFGDSEAKDIMIPKIDIHMVPSDIDYSTLRAAFRESMYTRLPVYSDDTDNVIGFVNIKDFLFIRKPENFKVMDILRDAYYTYEFKKTADLMIEMRKASFNVAFVLNEYGACMGMITLEDLLEEIVGEIRDEYDNDETELIRETGEGTYLIEASMKLDDINDALGTALESEDYDSIGGLLIEALDRLPKAMDTVTLDNGITLTAQSVSRSRIQQVVMVIPCAFKEAQADDSVTEPTGDDEDNAGDTH